ncbi:MAG: hypothetical protein QXF85_00330 [Candidatus Micrarchaeaceae archaeon]
MGEKIINSDKIRALTYVLRKDYDSGQPKALAELFGIKEANKPDLIVIESKTIEGVVRKNSNRIEDIALANKKGKVNAIHVAYSNGSYELHVLDGNQIKEIGKRDFFLDISENQNTFFTIFNYNKTTFLYSYFMLQLPDTDDYEDEQTEKTVLMYAELGRSKRIGKKMLRQLIGITLKSFVEMDYENISGIETKTLDLFKKNPKSRLVFVSLDNKYTLEYVIKNEHTKNEKIIRRLPVPDVVYLKTKDDITMPNSLLVIPIENQRNSPFKNRIYEAEILQIEELIRAQPFKDSIRYDKSMQYARPYA